MMENNRNFLLAMVLSIAVLVGWQFFVISPRMTDEGAATTTAAEGSLQSPTVPAGTPQEQAVAPAGRESIPQAAAQVDTLTRDAAIAASPRVTLDTPSLLSLIHI